MIAATCDHPGTNRRTPIRHAAENVGRRVPPDRLSGGGRRRTGAFWADFAYIYRMNAPGHSQAVAAGSTAQRVDHLVARTVNAPYIRVITPEILASCIATGNFHDWIVHVAAFFTDVRPNLILSFASQHSIGVAQLAKVYDAMKAKTGERNLGLEAKLDSVARAA
ncbi:hypothetical protein [Phreatobacter stygius]|uniref:Uncharacterized protein n=1 Tax=Phreatobacter stygius TaxID=1940610 RepID=A0A4D7B8F1_9HYPH|nr:hypothetical protein [Phreatobacter stygius]QCI67123.1 hypothetical protein E8M01_24525 [Phreatobacter stygius]